MLLESPSVVRCLVFLSSSAIALQLAYQVVCESCVVHGGFVSSQRVTTPPGELLWFALVFEGLVRWYIFADRRAFGADVV